MTDNNTVRYGILSTASIVPRFVKGMELCGNGTVDAIASRDIHKAETAAQELGIKKAYGDYHELLDDPDIDAVYIPVINSLHYTYAKDALNKGKHVIVEKPFVLHASEAEELFENNCPDDPHYNSIKAMKAYVQELRGDYAGAAETYREAIRRTVESYGRNKDFDLLMKNCALIYDKMGKPEEKEKLYAEFAE